MTTEELIDNLSETLMWDDRILSLPERELLTNVLQHASVQAGSREDVVFETIARAVGETIAQRTFGVLGKRVAHRVLQHTSRKPFVAVGLRSMSSLTASESHTEPIHAQGPSVGPPPSGPRPPSPGPPAPGLSTPSVHAQGPSTGPPPPAGARPPSPGPPAPGISTSVHAQGPSVGPPPSGPRPPSPGPPAPGMTATEAEHGNVAVMEVVDLLPAECVVLEEFLVPAELDALMQDTLERETEFQVSEVVSPGVRGGLVDYEQRRSRVLSNLGKPGESLVEHVRACLPRILPKLHHQPFPISRVEAQITASNDGDFFHWHCDNNQEEIASREITFVYFFHREPKEFRGGELRIYDSRWENGGYVPTENYRTIVPRQNQIVLFPSSLAHEITPVECPSGTFTGSRFTLNGWLHK